MRYVRTTDSCSACTDARFSRQAPNAPTRTALQCPPSGYGFTRPLAEPAHGAATSCCYLGDVAIDHITPKKRLGLNCENNLQALHDACNAEKRTRSMAEAPHARYRNRRGCSALYPCDACYERVVERREARRRERSKRLSGPI